MVDPQRKKMIDYLVADQFPINLRFGKLITKHGLVPAEEQIAKAAVLRAELEALGDEALKSRYDAVSVERATAFEAAHPFNQPYAKADFGHWAKLAYWKVDEGIALLLGRAPTSLVWDSVKGISSPVIWQFARIREVATRAVSYKQLYDPGYPGSFIIWAKRFDFPVPVELEEKVVAYGHFIGDWYTNYQSLKANYDELRVQSAASSAKALEVLKKTGDDWTKLYNQLRDSTNANHQSAMGIIGAKNETIKKLSAEVERLRNEQAAPAPVKQLGQREGDSLRKLVIGMAVAAYKYDPNAGRTSIIAEIVSDLENLGLTLSDDTVRKHLGAAADLLPPQGAPERRKS
jgi:hypothetical protein